MKKTMTNGEIFTMANVLFGGNGHTGLARKSHLKTRIAIRHAMKFNYVAIQAANKVIIEMIQEITNEIIDDFVENGKAEQDDNGCKVKDEFMDEFQIVQQSKLNELSEQKNDIELYTFSQEDLDAYEKQNDGEFTDAELDTLEFFIEKENETVEE